MLETTCEPLQYVEFWDDEHNSVNNDDFTEDVYSDDEELNEKSQDCNDIYSDEKGFKFTIVRVKNETRYLFYY